MFICSSTQTELYDGTFHEVIDGLLQGYNGTIFVYGQSGTGKFFTMQGNSVPQINNVSG